MSKFNAYHENGVESMMLLEDGRTICVKTLCGVNYTNKQSGYCETNGSMNCQNMKPVQRWTNQNGYGPRLNSV